MLWPSIRKKAADFICDEEGAISKAALVRLGVVSAVFSLVARPALACSNSVSMSFDIAGTDYHPECAWTGFVFEANLGVREVSDGSDHCRIEVKDAAGEDVGEMITLTSAACTPEFWVDREMPWVVPTENCSIDGSGSERFMASIEFHDFFTHSNALDIAEGDLNHGVLAVTHQHSVENNPLCDYTIDLEASTGDPVWGCCDNAVEAAARWGVVDHEGTTLVSKTGNVIQRWKYDCEATDYYDCAEC